MKTELESKEILRLSNEESNKFIRECLRTAMFKLIPTLVVMENGKIVNQAMGARPKNAILAML